MAGQNGRSAAPLTLSVPPSASDELAVRAYTFEFGQAVRLLEMLSPHAASVGDGADPQREPVRFRSSFSLAFPASELQELRNDADGGPPELTVNFLGLGGALGPLPHALTEWVLARVAAKDFALRDFLDVFNHRLISIFFRSRRKSRLGMEWSSPEEQRFADYLRAVIGILTDGLKERMALPDRALLGYAGLLSKRPRDIVGLATLLTDYFGAAVEVRPLRGAFRALAAERQTRIGERGQNRVLGETALLGSRVWDQQAGIELRVGPLSFARYTDFLPGRPGHTALWQLARFYMGQQLDIHITLLLKGADIPQARLGRKGTAELGQAAFLSLGTSPGGVFTIALGVLRAFTEPAGSGAPNAGAKGNREGGDHGDS